MSSNDARRRAAEGAFHGRLAELGATALAPYINAQTPVPVRCASGHECRPRPGNVRQGQGICGTCAGHDREAAEVAFRDRLAERGATMVGPYVNNRSPVLVRCAAGHECRPSPGYVAAGGGICRTCADRDPAVAEARFLARLAELGATPLAAYINRSTPVQARCNAGHECRPRPADVLRGDGVCRKCARRDPAEAEAAFRSRVAELGGAVLGNYLTALTPVLVRCRLGHESTPRPARVQQGAGICRYCGGKTWDAFYVVTSRLNVKFGISSGDPLDRLYRHAKRGYTTVVRLARELPGTVAPDAERAVISALALAGEQPSCGREYFDIACLALILDVADSWLVPPVPHRPPGAQTGLEAG